MHKISQKELVYTVLVQVLGKKYSPHASMLGYFGFTPGKRNSVKEGSINSNLEKAIKILFEEKNEGRLKIPSSFKGRELIYIRRVIYNWLTRDKRLNGHLNNVEKVRKNYHTFDRKLLKKISMEPRFIKLMKSYNKSKVLSSDELMEIAEVVLLSAMELQN